MKTIGIAGAGIMAKGMALNFLKQGYAVSVWNRTKDHSEDLLKAGAEWVEEPKQLATCDIVIECVSDDEASRDVWTNPSKGILSLAKQSSVYIASSSLSLDWVDELSNLCKKQSIRFLDMPITGSRPGAEGGTLKLLVGGDKEVLESIRKELEAIADKIFYFGPAGSGMRFKLMLNTLIGVQTVAAVQAASLAQKAGIDPVVFREALEQGPMGPSSVVTSNALKAAAASLDSLNFSVKWLEKDLRYAQDMAKKYGVNFDLLNETQQDYSNAIEAGLGDEDQTNISKLFKTL